MNYTTLTPRGSEPETVCLVGIGADGRQFIAALRAEAPPPLAELLRPLPHDISEVSHPSKAEDIDLSGVVILFMAFSSTAIREEADAAWWLVRHVKRDHDDIHLIGIFLQSEGDTQQQAAQRLDVKRIFDAVDGRIFIPEENAFALRQSVGWMFAALRKLTLDGTLILEPAWDLQDVVEVLELPGAELHLMTATVGKAESIGSTVDRSLESLVAEGVELEFVGGMMVILWYASSESVTSSQRREASRAVDGLLGQGVLHMTLSVRTHTAWNEIRACMTLIVSTWDRWPSLPPADGGGAES